MQTLTSRSRWAAVGAAVAVTLGAGGIGITHATTSSGEKPVYVPIEPCRLADNRPAGIAADTAVTFDGWGTVGDCTLPAGTAGLALNVTAVGATQQTNLRFYPADAATPATANLNPTPGAPPTPNAVNVSLDATGKFKVYNKFGTVAVIIDVMGYYDDHNHDDRYYTEAEVDSAIASAVAGGADVYTKTETDGLLATKANTADVYTKAEVDAAVAAGPTMVFATVQPADASAAIVRGEGATAVTRLSFGYYGVTFDRDVSGCTWLATYGPGDGAGVDAKWATVKNVGVANEVRVVLRDADGVQADGDGFHLAAFCPG